MQWSKGRHSRCLYRTNHVEQAKQVCDFYKLCTVKARVELQNAERPHGKLLQSCSMTFNKGDYTFNFSQYITIPHTVTSRRRSRLPLTEKDPHFSVMKTSPFRQTHTPQDNPDHTCHTPQDNLGYFH